MNGAGLATSAGSIAANIAATGSSLGLFGFLSYKSVESKRKKLPTFHATADEAVESARADIDTLVTATSEHLHQVAADTTQQNARVDEASTDYDLNLTVMKDGTANLKAVTIGLIDSREENSGALQRSTETQINTQSSLASQQSAVQAIATSLENLPELLQLNREKQALRVEHARLLTEREGYASRTETLLSVLKEKNQETHYLVKDSGTSKSPKSTR